VAEHPAARLLAKLNSDRMPPALRDKLAALAKAFGIKPPRDSATTDGPRAEALAAAGFECVGRIGVPGGRRYGLFAIRAPVPPVVR
jgi:hypothetical protein